MKRLARLTRGDEKSTGAGISEHGAALCSTEGETLPQPSAVKALSSHRIWLRYNDRTEGDIDLSNLAGHGVCEPRNDAALFNAVHRGSHGASEWSSDVDLCPDAMYVRLTGKSVESGKLPR